jgi:hypothetical protein
MTARFPIIFFFGPGNSAMPPVNGEKQRTCIYHNIKSSYSKDSK